MIRFFKSQIKYEFKAGIKSRWKMYGFLVFVFLLLGISIFFSLDNEVSRKLTMTDYMVRIFTGIDAMTFYLPTEWAVIQIIYLLFVGTYPKKDYTQRGYQVFLRTKNKILWWLGKCFWLIMTTACFYLLLYIIIFGISQFTGSGIEHAAIIRNVWGLQNIRINTTEGMLVLYVMPWLTMLAIGFGQMLISFLLNSTAAVMISVCYLISSIYMANPALLGNYSMLLRNYQMMDSGGVSCFIGMICSVSWIFLISLLGCIYIKKSEMLS